MRLDSINYKLYHVQQDQGHPYGTLTLTIENVRMDMGNPEAWTHILAQVEAQLVKPEPKQPAQSAGYLPAPIPAPAKQKPGPKPKATPAPKKPLPEIAHPHADLAPDDIKPSDTEPEDPSHEDDEGAPEPEASPFPLPKDPTKPVQSQFTGHNDKPSPPAPKPSNGKLRVTQALRDAQTLSAVLKELQAQGVNTPEGALKACRALQAHVPYLAKVDDLDARVPSKFAVLLEG